MKRLIIAILFINIFIGATSCGRIPLYNEGESDDSVIRDDIANALTDEGAIVQTKDDEESAIDEEEPILKEWKNGQIMIDDISYEMPFVFSELINAGWTVKEDEEEILSSILEPGEETEDSLHMEKEGYPELIFLVRVTNLTEKNLPLLDCQVTSIWYDAKGAMESGGEYPTISVNGLILGSSLENVERCFGTYEVKYDSETLTMVLYKYFEGEKALYLTFDYNEELGVTAVICNAFDY